MSTGLHGVQPFRMGNGWVSLNNHVYVQRRKSASQIGSFLSPARFGGKQNLSNEHLESNHTQPLTDTSKTRSIVPWRSFFMNLSSMDEKKHQVVLNIQLCE